MPFGDGIVGDLGIVLIDHDGIVDFLSLMNEYLDVIRLSELLGGVSLSGSAVKPCKPVLSPMALCNQGQWDHGKQAVHDTTRNREQIA